MKKLAFILLPTLIFCFSCNSSINKFFGKRTPHESYADKVEDSPAGQQWVTVSKKALNNPHTIKLPYRHVGYFPADKPRALALRFGAKKGQRITFDISKKEKQAFILFADLYQQNADNVSHLFAADTTASQFYFDIKETGNYILRLQPDLYRTGEYDLSASIGPSLGFPVAGNKARTGSFWGDDRDAGKRRHEGIDIFAVKLTPAIAAADGYITRVSEGGIGGKTVWLNVSDNDIYLYYAHLDKQLVQEGQSIKKGDTLGLVGNTGNAKFTPPHLHFGVYSSSGPVDPFPFVNKTIQSAPSFKAKELTGYLKLKHTAKSKRDTSNAADDLLLPLAVTASGYLVENSAGNIIEAPFSAVKIIKKREELATEKRSAGMPGS